LPYDASFNNGIPPIEIRPRFDENLGLLLRAWSEDALVPVGYLDDWRAELPDSQGVVIDDCGHIPQVEQLDQTVAVVQKFLGTP